MTGCSGASGTSSSASAGAPRRPRSPAAAQAQSRRSRSGRDRSVRPATRQAPPPAARHPIRPVPPVSCPRSDTPAFGPRSGAPTGSPAPLRGRAAVPRAAGRGQPGFRRSHRSGSGWSSRTPPSTPRADPPAPRCACAGCARTGAGGGSARARSARRARPARRSAVRRSTANLLCELGCEPSATPVAGSAVENSRLPAAFGRIKCDGVVRTSSATGCDAKSAPVAACRLGIPRLSADPVQT